MSHAEVIALLQIEPFGRGWFQERIFLPKTGSQ